MKTKLPYLQCRGEAWDKARMRTLVRDNFQCQAHKLNLCSEPCTETRLRFLHVHHIEERQNGGTHDLNNLITVCRVHHVQIHPHMAFDYAVTDKELDAPDMPEL